MNLDLIQKLIRLANNNPNDNEANLAARKACKMLEDYQFNATPKVSPKVTVKPQSPYQRPTYDGAFHFSEAQYNYMDRMFSIEICWKCGALKSYKMPCRKCDAL